MNRLGGRCIDCGSAVVLKTVDEVKPVFRMEILNYECGAVLKTTFSSNGNVARACHYGCEST